MEIFIETYSINLIQMFTLTSITLRRLKIYSHLERLALNSRLLDVSQIYY